MDRIKKEGARPLFCLYAAARDGKYREMYKRVQEREIERMCERLEDIDIEKSAAERKKTLLLSENDGCEKEGVVV